MTLLIDMRPARGKGFCKGTWSLRTPVGYSLFTGVALLIWISGLICQLSNVSSEPCILKCMVFYASKEPAILLARPMQIMRKNGDE